MRQFLVVSALVVGGVLAWRIGDTLSSDAISMGLGIFFGMLAGLPAALLVMAASRRGDYVGQSSTSGRREADSMYGRSNSYGGYNGQPPVIVVTAPNMLPQNDPRAQQMAAPGLPMWPAAAPRPARQFHVVGEQDEMVEEW